MSSEPTMSTSGATIIQAHDLGKCYKIYDNPKARLKQALWRGRKQYYKEFWALRNVSFEVKRGESLGIIGRNGSGKSTLLQLICGTLTPTEGSLRAEGRIAALLELGSGFNPEFTGLENVYLNASLLGLTKQQTESRIDDIKAFADIGDFINQPVKTYSSGMLVRLAFAVVAHVEPSVLIIDEALSVGDAVFGQRCMRFIRRFTDTGTLLFVSHDLNAVSSLCDRALWINSGKLRLDSANTRVVTAYTRHCLQTTRAESDDEKTDLDSRSQTAISSNSKKDSEAQASQENNPKSSSQVNSNYEPSKIHDTINVADWNEAHDYGNRHAIIKRVSLIDAQGQETTSPLSGEYASLIIIAYCTREIKNFMSGFIVRDKTGMIIWGENNIKEGGIQLNAGDNIETIFAFSMPFLKAGSYSISAAVSEDDFSIPTVMHYKPDTLTIEPIQGKRPVHGVFALPNMTIKSEINP